jgi:hypothetical protein
MGVFLAPARFLPSGAMPTPKSSARTLASIRQLCCLNLHEELLVPNLLDALHAWVPADTRHFIWADEKTLMPANYTGDGFTAVEVMQRYFTHNSKIDYPGVAPAFPTLMRTFTSGIFGHGNEGVESYLRSDMYQDVLRPLDGRYMLYMVVRDLNGHPRGHLSLLRGASSRPFSEGERQKLVQLDPYLRHAFSARVLSEPAGENLAAEGMAVLGEDGTLRYQDQAAKKLLWMASHEQIDSMALIHLDTRGITPHMQRLHQRLVGVFRGQNVAPPAWDHRNRWGRFLFRATWLDGAEGKAVGVTVSHYIPRTLKAWQGLHRLDLAPRQQQVALLFSEGRTVADIAAELNLSRNTVGDYLDVIYERLGIKPGRESLQEVLLR